MGLFAFLLFLAGLGYWVGNRGRWDIFGRWGKVAAPVFIVLAAILGYFAWRKARTVAELAELIDPVPAITEVIYIPTAAEVSWLTQTMARMPTPPRTGAGPEARRALAEHAKQRHTDYWLFKTELTPDSVFQFYRAAAPGRGWTVVQDAPPFFGLARGGERLMLFVTDDWPRKGTKVLYGLGLTAGQGP